MADLLAKAVVEVLDGSRQGLSFPVMFNPTEYSVEHSASYQETGPAGLSNPVLQFVNGNAKVLTMDLLFDTYTDGQSVDVSQATRLFTDLVDVDAKTHAPPRVRFIWGSTWFKAVIEKVTQRFTMFRPEGFPVRATLTVTFKQYRPISEQLNEPRRESSDKTKRRVLESHDSIWLMAHREYGDVRFWRIIARANRIEDPRTIEPGTVLVLPALEELLAGEERRGPNDA